MTTITETDLQNLEDETGDWLLTLTIPGNVGELLDGIQGNSLREDLDDALAHYLGVLLLDWRERADRIAAILAARENADGAGAKQTASSQPDPAPAPPDSTSDPDPPADDGDGKKVEPPAKKPAKPPATKKGGGTKAARDYDLKDLTDRVHKALRQHGKMSVAGIARAVGLADTRGSTSTERRKAIEVSLAELERDMLAAVTGRVRGGGDGWEAFTPDPKTAPAATTPPPAQPTPQSDPDEYSDIDEGDVPAHDPYPEPLSAVPIADRSRARKAGLSDQARILNADLDTYLREHGPTSARALHEALQLADRGVTRARLVQTMQRNPWTETRGEAAGETLWRHVPKPEEVEGVTIRHADRNGRLSPQILEHLTDAGPLDAAELATHLVRPVRDVATALSALAAAGEIEKTQTGKYERTRP